MLCLLYPFFFFFKQKTAYEMRISDWSSDVCSSDLARRRPGHHHRLAGLPDHRGGTLGACHRRPRLRGLGTGLRSNRLGGLSHVGVLTFVTAGEIVRHFTSSVMTGRAAENARLAQAGARSRFKPIARSL